MMRSGDLLLGIDIGGTFTDIVALDTATGQRWSTKTPTTPHDQSEGFIAGVDKILDTIGERRPIAQILHGTTVATNAILEGKGGTAALITSEGFRHVLEIGRHDIPRKANMFSWVKPARPVPAKRIVEVAGRIDVDGAEHVPLDEAAVRAAAEAFAAEGLDTIAVCLIHAYANPAHERRVAEIVREVIPDALISLSSDVLPVFREYERSMVTILNAYVMPPVSRYVGRLGARIAETGATRSLLLMNSGGGVMSAATAGSEPVQTALSGPAAGALGAAATGLAAGRPDVISIDIGGTSADVTLIKDGRPTITKRGTIGEWPVHTPMVDMVTIGAGGGSIARVTDGGSLTVGPESAGAVPGPACYGRGGTLPTVSDAHLVLGRLCPHLLDDAMALDVEAARRAVHDHVAAPLGLTVERAAEGILEVINNAMVGAIRLVSVERGLDPRDFALLAFGGAGPLHGPALARLLGMSSVIVPPNPGVLSAVGLTVADLRNDFSLTCVERGPDHDLARLAATFAGLEDKARSWLASEGIAEGASRTEWEASLRYRHQGFELAIPWPGHEVGAATLAKLFEAFHQTHERLYTFAQRDTPVEIVTLSVTAHGRLDRPEVATPAGVREGDPIVARQPLWSGGRFVDCPVYDRARLAAGTRVEGPAILRQLDTTTVIEAGQSASIHPSGSAIVTV
ncbi:5-oxoprolinase [Acuticoccus sediminis]|uniref:5-oxoprolinase n=1 Tax=Acuticoccus sediminis TaxID=2184697 RepID=A0A8B2P154_9HYPH|nr:hydantoinase/oxoprolinase family protein [Acuticoccus sediminis]RAI02520.1 5-oxoprolinase [Acuticoccus sediminis]